MDHRLTPEPYDRAVTATPEQLDPTGWTERVSNETALRPLYGVAPSHDVILVAVRRQRNQLLPVNKLPIEVLSSIFRAYTFALHNDEERTLHNATLFVCAHWRAVALNDSMLWRRLAISAMAVHLVGAILDRAKCAALSLELALKDPDTPGARCRLLSARLRGGPFLQQLYYTPALHLERLGLHYVDPTASGVLIPNHLFAQNTPKLRTLQLENVLPDGAHHFLLSKVTSLEEIRLSCGTAGKELSAKHLCALFQSRSIRSIAIRDCSFAEGPDRDTELQLHAKWSVPELKSLTLDCVESSAALHILERLNLQLLQIIYFRIAWPDGRLGPLVNAVLRSMSMPTHLSVRGDQNNALIELRESQFCGRSFSVHIPVDSPLRSQRHPAWASYWPPVTPVLRTMRCLFHHLWVTVDMWPGVVHALSGAQGNVPLPGSRGSRVTSSVGPLNLPPLELVELTLELADLTGDDAQQTLESFEPALLRGFTLRAPSLHAITIVARPGRRNVLAGFLLDTFLQQSVKYTSLKLQCLTLDNVDVEPGYFWDATRKRVDKVVIVR
ncbi:hypothetical protein BKA62DRAFT_277999 [Auriculariales sp. MPI-PUGE-AT-0066]|nr:hypothetical protein BKA62DRAFT_277999 [Auriculariales sp. MPI-PUGE-AT-0066]